VIGLKNRRIGVHLSNLAEAIEIGLGIRVAARIDLLGQSLVQRAGRHFGRVDPRDGGVECGGGLGDAGAVDKQALEPTAAVLCLLARDGHGVHCPADEAIIDRRRVGRRLNLSHHTFQRLGATFDFADVKPRILPHPLTPVPAGNRACCPRRPPGPPVEPGRLRLPRPGRVLGQFQVCLNLRELRRRIRRHLLLLGRQSRGHE
jgi:hypothetical protein